MCGFFDNGNKIYSPKYITAEITDDHDNIHFFPITNTFDGYFMVEINKQLYAFTTKNARILRYRQKIVRSFGVIQYDVSNYSSIKPEIKELELAMKKNSLPKMNMRLFNILRVLGNREKNEFRPHDINKLIAEFEKEWGEEYPEKVTQIKTYLKELDIDHIVTPLRKITDFIHEDLIATSPNFLASVVPKLESVEYEHKKINNEEIKGHKNLLKYIVIALLAVVIIAGVAIANDKGFFKPLTDVGKGLQDIQKSGIGIPAPGSFSGAAPPGQDYSDASIMARYPTPEALRDAVQAGTIDYNKLSQFAKDSIDSIEVVAP